MIGKINMEVSHAEIVAAIQYYLNESVFTAGPSLRTYHKAKVVKVRQRESGRFVIDFEGISEDDTSDR